MPTLNILVGQFVLGQHLSLPGTLAVPVGLFLVYMSATRAQEIGAPPDPLQRYPTVCIQIEINLGEIVDIRHTAHPLQQRCNW